MGKPGWVGSRAWIWLFSSNDSTSACSGGFRYRPTMSSSFSAKTGIVAQLEGFHAVRLQTVTVPDAPYTGLADTGHGGHGASAPVSRMRGSFLRRLGNHYTHEIR